jgi:hypothetical protein
MRRLLRTLLPAVFLAVLQAPLALGQMEQPEIYAYHSLLQYGGVVFGFVGTDIAYPPYTNHCDFGCNNNCWDAYTSYAEVALYWDGYWMGGYSGALWDTGVSAYMQVDAWAGVWTLEATHYVEDLYYRDAYGFQWHEPWMPDHQWEDLTINPEISISGSQYVDDGGTGYFYVTVQDGSPTLYSWSYDHDPGGGNYPNVDFSDAWSPSTLTNGHWYASPDGACAAGRQAQYSITATVEFDQPPLTLYDTSSLYVVLPEIGGATYPPWLMPYISTALVDGLWRVLPESYFVKHDPPVLKAFTSQSQFYEKVVAHEDVHVNQYMPGGLYHLNEDLYSATAARNTIIGLTDATAEGLDDKIEQAFQEWWAGQTNLDTQRLVQAEAQAYAVSDGMAPPYKYQSQCGGL